MISLFKLVRSGLGNVTKVGRLVLYVYTLMLTVVTGLDGIALLMMAKLVSDSKSSSVTEDLVTTAIAIVGLFLLRSALATIISWRGMKLFAHEEVNIGQQNLLAIEHFSWLQRQKLELSDYYAAIDRGPNALVQGVLVTFATLVAEILSALIILSVVLFLQPTTAVTALIYFGLVAYLQHKFLSVGASDAGKVVNSSFSKIYDMISDRANLSKVLEVMPSKSFNKVIETSRSELAVARAKVNFIAALPRYFMESILAIGFLIIGGVTLFFDGPEKIIGSLVVFATAGFRLLPIINRIQGLILQLFATAPLAREAILFKDTESPYGSTHSEISPVSTGKLDPKILVKIEGGSFRFPNQERNTLENLNIDIEFGKQYAIVGPSGAGKTTLVDIILGLIALNSGHVVWNSSFDRASIAYVPQDSSLLSGSITQNVALEWSRDSIDEVKVRSALLHANLSDNPWVDSELTPTNPRIQMSGGQRQRLGIARAFYRDAQLIVFDESTSALDMILENEIMKTVQDLRGKKTVIIVAHRLSTIQRSDEVIYLDKGKVLGKASFQELRKLVPDFNRQIELGKIL